MPAVPLPALTAELMARAVEALGKGAPAMVNQLAYHGIALVDATRSSFLVDVRVHEGVLYRNAQYRQRLDQAEVWAAHVTPVTGVWRRLSQEAA